MGIVLALCATVSWSISPLAFGSAGRLIGSFSVNVLRLGIAACVFAAIVGISLLVPGWTPVYPGAEQAMWIAASGLMHLAVGDTMFYASLVSLGPRRSALVMTLAPVVSVAVGWLWLGEALPPMVLAGVCTVLGAIAYAVDLERRTHKSGGREPGGVSVRGVAQGVGGAVCMGFAAVLLRKAFNTRPDMDPLSATAVRVGSAALVIWLIPVLRYGPRSMTRFLAMPHVAKPLLVGTLFGPLIGMLCYVSAMKFAEAGLVSTLAAMTPIVIIPVVAVVYRTRVRKRAILAAVIAVAGVTLISVGR